ESFWECDSLQFDLIDYCWGEINEGASCTGADLGIACKGNVDEIIDLTNARMHVGSTVLAFDKDGDNDKDLVLGDVTCSNLVYYKNGGDVAYAEMVSKDTSFPSNTVSVKFREYLASFLLDITGDDNKDLIVSTNDDNFGLNADNIWYYKNLNTNDTFDFDYVQNNFLIEGTIDVGAKSKPVFADYNMDGLMDLIIGSDYFYGESEIKKYSLWLYENIGTLTDPEFTLIIKDLAELSTYNIPNLFPAMADIDNDGDNDLFAGASDGTILFCENVSGVFAAPEFSYHAIDIGSNSAPVFFDANADGLLDLIIGGYFGNIFFYKNTGSITEPSFILENEIWGGVDVREIGYVTGYSTPCMYKNEQDSLILLVGSEFGKIHKYDEIEDALAGEFHERDSTFLDWIPGFHSTVSTADINADGFYDFVVGNMRGGIQFFMYDNDVAIENEIKNTITVYPNPVSDKLYIKYLQDNIPEQITVMNILSQHINNLPVQQDSFDVSFLSSGIYFLEIIFEDNKRTVTSFIIQ
ncbi:MAG: T9SS type A sorting domain-containing protein, partial [Fimbriimonadaceae bacterium]|nr:T9SS type A sorting domain-containing protein [Chitinophagales bacterium]